MNLGGNSNAGSIRSPAETRRVAANPLASCDYFSLASLQQLQSATPRPQSRYNDGVSFHIRQFEKTDFDTLWRIDQACFDPQLAYSRPELAFYMRRPGSFTLVAEAETRILGFVVAEIRRKSGHIITIDVISETRRTGVGSALLHAAEEQLLRSGAVAVALETPVSNEAAIRFYMRMGYFVEKTVAGYYSGQLDALVMTKELARHEIRRP